jgi:chromosome partitioning protein
MLTQAIAVSNGKGGVGKTSIAANVAAVAAASGWQVLVIDLDPQGNVGSDLGYKQQGLSDEGEALAQAIQFGRQLIPPAIGVRPNLDAVPAGRATLDLAAVLQQRHMAGVSSAEALSAALGSIEEDYDLVVFDCPPGDNVLGDLGLAAARGLVVPVRFDAGSLDGLELMATRFARIKGGGVNPNLVLLGIVLFDFPLRATALRAQVEAELANDFATGVRVFDTAIRHSQRAAFDMRREGITAAEYELLATADRTQRLELLRTDFDALRAAGPARSQAAAGLAEDYVALANELLGVFAELAPVEVGT